MANEEHDWKNKIQQAWEDNNAVLGEIQICKDVTCSCNQYHCPFCKFETGDTYKAIHYHVQTKHLQHSININGEVVLKCIVKDCIEEKRKRAHYHCHVCRKTIVNKKDFLLHIQKQHAYQIHVPSNEELFSDNRPGKPVLECKEENTKERIEGGNSSPSTPGECDSFSYVSLQKKKRYQGLLKSQKKSMTKCEICDNNYQVSSIKRHMQEKHSITFSQFGTVSVDCNKGLFLVSKTLSGWQQPIHVQKKTTKDTILNCEACGEAVKLAHNSGLVAYECPHMLAVNNTKPEDVQELNEMALEQCVQERLLNNKKVDELRILLEACNHQGCHLIVPFKAKKFATVKVTYFSVYEGKVHDWAKFGRTVTSFDSVSGNLYCKCSPLKRFCIHRAATIWYLFQFDRDVLKSQSRSFDDHDIALDDGHFFTQASLSSDDDNNESCNEYPPTGINLKKMVEYIFEYKKNIKYVCQRKPLKLENCPDSFIPHDTTCIHCDVLLSEPLLVKKNARIVSWHFVKTDISVFCKICPSCKMIYRYQESCDGVMNFDDFNFFSLYLQTIIQAALQKSIPISSTIDVMKESGGMKNIPTDGQFINAYLFYTALTEREYEYFCKSCGYYPPVLLFDGCKNTVFKMNVSDIEEPSHYVDGAVDVEEFWSQLSKEIICRGLIKDQSMNPYIVKPKYDFWAPWISPVNRGNVINTEYEKLQAYDVGIKTKRVSDYTDEDEYCGDTILDLLDERCKHQREDVQTIAKLTGIKNLKLPVKDLVREIMKQMQEETVYNKVFKKLVGASGGYVVCVCPHHVVYGYKPILRTEGPRDVLDILLSFRYAPNISISDMAPLVAAHERKRNGGTFFTPYNGRIFEATAENIQAANEDQLRPVSFSWLSNTKGGHNSAHPITGCPDHYILLDKLHQQNYKGHSEKLRQIQYVQELHGTLNSQAQEQFFSKHKKKNGFVNQMKLSSHVFLMRALFEDQNIRINSEFVEKMKKTFGRDLYLDNVGKLTIGDEKNTSLKDGNYDIDYLDLKEPSKVKTHEPHFEHFEPMPHSEKSTNDNTFGHASHINNTNLDREGKKYHNLKRDKLSKTPLINRRNVPNLAEIENLLGFLNLQKPASSDIMSTLIDIATSECEHFHQMEDCEKRAFRENIFYVVDVINNQEYSENDLNFIYGFGLKMQMQVSNNLCAVAALNNAVGVPREGSPIFNASLLTECADRMWQQQILEHNLGLRSPTEPMRSKFGDFNITCMEEAANVAGYSLNRVNLPNLQFIQNLSSEATLDAIIRMCFEFSETPAFLICQNIRQHYVTLVFRNDSFFLLDSLRQYPDILENAAALKLIIDELNKARGAVYYIRKKVQNLNESEQTEFNFTQTKAKGFEPTIFEDKKSTKSEETEFDFTETKTRGFEPPKFEQNKFTEFGPMTSTEFKERTLKECELTTTIEISNSDLSANDDESNLYELNGTLTEIWEKHDKKVNRFRHVVHNASNINQKWLSVSDILALKPNTDVNNRIIDFVGDSLIHNHKEMMYCPTELIPVLERNSPIPASLQVTDIRMYKRIFIPIHEPGHWWLVVIDIEKGVYGEYDSMNKLRESHYHQQLINKFTSNVFDLDITKYKPLTSIERSCIQRQSNSHDCGIHLIVRILSFLVEDGFPVTKWNYAIKSARSILGNYLLQVNKKEESGTLEEHMLRGLSLKYNMRERKKKPLDPLYTPEGRKTTKELKKREKESLPSKTKKFKKK